MAAYIDLFNGLSNNQSELLDPPDSVGSKFSEDEDNAWYNQPLDLEEEDDEDNAYEPSLVLASQLVSLTLKPAVLVTLTKKEHTAGARIRAIYMLYKKKTAVQITVVTGVSRSQAYSLAAVARERG